MIRSAVEIRLWSGNVIGNEYGHLLMSSLALTDWQTTRTDRIGELLEAHSAIGGSGPGRRWRTQQINWAIILRLAAEFQGFVKDLHSEASDFLLARVKHESAQAGRLLEDLVRRDRMIDHGNPSPQNIAKDFRRLGIELWGCIQARDTRATAWESRLEALMKARNAIAHDDQGAFAQLQRAGWKLGLVNARSWFGTLGALTAAMDRTVRDELASAFGQRPWR